MCRKGHLPSVTSDAGFGLKIGHPSAVATNSLAGPQREGALRNAAWFAGSKCLGHFKRGLSPRKEYAT